MILDRILNLCKQFFYSFLTSNKGPLEDSYEEINLRLESFKRLPALSSTPVDESIELSDFSIPEINFSDLTSAVLRDAIVNYGALIVKQAMDKESTAILRDLIDAARDDRESVLDGTNLVTETVNYRPLEDKYNKGSIFVRKSIYLAESPKVFKFYFDYLAKSGLKDIVLSYLGGSAAMSVEKSVLRKALPDNTDQWDYAWHQDGAFLGDDIHSLNLWLTLSDCGAEAPSLDLVTKRYKSVLPTGTDRASYDWSLGPDLVKGEITKYGYEHLLLAEGDIVLFDHYNTHRTGMLKGMTKPRYAAESWFFSEHGFPKTKTGLKL